MTTDLGLDWSKQASGARTSHTGPKLPHPNTGADFLPILPVGQRERKRERERERERERAAGFASPNG
jgi:hypothetical protein